MRFFRIGDKLVSLEKLLGEVMGILQEREKGATQEEVAASHGVQRSFVSFLESLGEVRRGARVALVGFPVANAEAVRSLAEECAVEFVLVFSQAEREWLEGSSASDMFNRVLETLAALKDFDVIVVLASDWRITLVERILGREVVGIPIGHSPLRQDVEVDLDELRTLLEDVLCRSVKVRPARGAGRMLERAVAAAGRWQQSRK